MRSAGSWDRVKGRIGRFIQRVLGLLNRKVLAVHSVKRGFNQIPVRLEQMR